MRNFGHSFKYSYVFEYEKPSGGDEEVNVAAENLSVALVMFQDWSKIEFGHYVEPSKIARLERVLVD